MNPFYEKRSGKLQIGVSDNMNFPAHLHDDVEVLYCLEGGVQVSVMGETHLVGKGECAVIFPERVHSYRSEDNSRALLFIFSTAMSGTYGRTIQKYYPENPFLEKKIFRRMRGWHSGVYAAGMYRRMINFVSPGFR